MEKKRRQLTLVERWELDIEIAKQGGTFLIEIPQCKICKNYIKGNTSHCLRYVGEIEKPEYVVFPSKECPRFEHKNTLEVKVKNQEEEGLYGGLLGFCVGDALGVPVEFTSRKERKKDPVREMRAYGTYHQPFGTWSDDSSLTLCLLESLLEGYSVDNLSKKFIKYYREGYMTPHEEVFDIGNTTRVSIEKMIQGVRPIECGGKSPDENGNGSLMRVLPLAYYTKRMYFKDKIEIIEQVSSLTHAHKRSKLACIFYVELAIRLMEDRNKKEAYKKTIDFINKYCRSRYEEEFVFFSRILDESILFLEEEKISSSGYVIDTLEAVIWCFMNSDSYQEAVLKAVNLGGDTDTIAAIVGGLAGIFYGYHAIPDNWIQCLVKKEKICDLIYDFSIASYH